MFLGLNRSWRKKWRKKKQLGKILLAYILDQEFHITNEMWGVTSPQTGNFHTYADTIMLQHFCDNSKWNSL